MEEHQDIYFEEKYNPNLKDKLDAYDKVYAQYLLNRPWNNRAGNWSDLAADFYQHPFHYRGVAEALDRQGFTSIYKKGRI